MCVSTAVSVVEGLGGEENGEEVVVLLRRLGGEVEEEVKADQRFPTPEEEGLVVVLEEWEEWEGKGTQRPG